MLFDLKMFKVDGLEVFCVIKNDENFCVFLVVMLMVL